MQSLAPTTRPRAIRGKAAAALTTAAARALARIKALRVRGWVRMMEQEGVFMGFLSEFISQQHHFTRPRCPSMIMLSFLLRRRSKEAGAKLKYYFPIPLLFSDPVIILNS